MGNSAKREGLFILAQSVIILLDATFEIVNNVGQMLIVHGIVNNTCSACLFVKMKNKSEETYVKVLKCIQKLGEERNVNIFKRDIAIKSDFENSLLAACKHTFSEPKHSGCFFHFVCNIRKSAEKKSRQLFNNDPNFRKLVRRVSMMCLLPKEYISPGVVIMYSNCTKIHLKMHIMMNILNSRTICYQHGLVLVGTSKKYQLVCGMFVIWRLEQTIYVKALIE